jgi:NYN domain
MLQLPVVPKVALYWDFENVHSALVPERVSGAEVRSGCGAAGLTMHEIMCRVRQHGRITINRAYVHWSGLSRFADDLNRHGLSLVQIFPRGGQGKNGADIHMCVDIVEDMLRLDIDVCVLVTGDSDFIGVVHKLRQYGKRVIGFGNRDWTSVHMVSACDEFCFFDELVPLASSVPAGVPRPKLAPVRKVAPLPPAPVPVLSPSEAVPVSPVLSSSEKRALLRQMVESYRSLLIAALSYLGMMDAPPTLSDVKLMMLRLDPSFDHKSRGAKLFGQFIDCFPDVVRRGGEDWSRVELLVPPDAGAYVIPVSKWSRSRHGRREYGDEVLWERDADADDDADDQIPF